MSQNLRIPFLLQSLRTPMWFNGWLIDWVNVACTFFHFFVENHFRFRLFFCFVRSTITRPIGRLELAEFGWFVSGKYRFLKCTDFEAYPRSQSINQPLKNVRVRRLWSKNGVRRLWDLSSYHDKYKQPVWRCLLPPKPGLTHGTPDGNWHTSLSTHNKSLWPRQCSLWNTTDPNRWKEEKTARFRIQLLPWKISTCSVSCARHVPQMKRKFLVQNTRATPPRRPGIF